MAESEHTEYAILYRLPGIEPPQVETTGLRSSEEAEAWLTALRITRQRTVRTDDIVSVVRARGLFIASRTVGAVGDWERA